MADNFATAAPRPATPTIASGRRAGLLRIAGDPESAPDVLDLVSQEAGGDEDVLLALARNPRAPDRTLARIAAAEFRRVLDALLQARDRLRAHPAIAETILQNPAADDGLRARARALLGDTAAGAASEPEPEREPSSQPAPQPDSSTVTGRRDNLLRIARDPAADPEALKLVVQQAGTDEEILVALARNPAAADETLIYVALVGSQAALGALAAQENRIRANPAIGQAILKDSHLEDGLRAAVRGILQEVGASPEALPAAAVAFGRDNLLKIALNPQADPAALTIVAREAGSDEQVFLALARNPKTPEKTLVYIGLVGPPPVLKELARQAARIQAHPEIAQAVLENPDADDALRAAVRVALQAAGPEAAKRPVPLYNLIKGMSTGQRLALAMKGSKDARMILVKDSNEMVALEVIYSPRITETEILGIAQMRDVNENVLRALAGSKLYRSNKAIVWALLNNPKTPTGTAMGLGLANLSEKELDGLARNRNISGTLQRAARSVLEKKRRRVGGGGHGH